MADITAPGHAAAQSMRQTGVQHPLCWCPAMDKAEWPIKQSDEKEASAGPGAKARDRASPIRNSRRRISIEFTSRIRNSWQTPLPAPVAGRNSAAHLCPVPSRATRDRRHEVMPLNPSSFGCAVGQQQSQFRSERHAGPDEPATGQAKRCSCKPSNKRAVMRKGASDRQPRCLSTGSRQRGFGLAAGGLVRITV